MKSKQKKTYIESLHLKNFRGYENLDVSFDKEYTVLIGLNGSGKSTILDALSIALGAYVGSFDDVRGNSISDKDARTITEQIGSRLEEQRLYPVEVKCTGVMNDSDSISWMRSLNGEGRKTTYGDASAINEIARSYQDRLRKQDQSLILPVIAYYGTGRLWSQSFSINSKLSSKKWNRQQGYADCLNTGINQSQMLNWFQEMTMIGLQENKQVPELNAVEDAVAECYCHSESSIDHARYYYSVKDKCLIMETEKDNTIEKLPVSSLSDGERGIISLVSDIAYRMAVLNPQLLDNITDTPGIVLIDELDMHLHPEWQKSVIHDLKCVFPNIQLIVTTHSPSILSNISAEHVRILSDWNVRTPDTETYGRNLNDLLLDLMAIDVRPEKIVKLQKEFDDRLDAEDYSKAEEVLNEMEKLMGSNSKEVQDNRITLDVEKAANDID